MRERLPTRGIEGTIERKCVRAFTLIELLVVVAIIGVLAAIALPALRGLGESNAIDAATRQVLDDLAYARLRAINDRTTVYLLFPPYNVEQQAGHLAPYRLTGYTLYSRRSVGEQPGRQSPRQLIPWRTLPDKTFFPIAKYVAGAVTNEYDRAWPLTNNFVLAITNRVYPEMRMNYLAFNPLGQLVRMDADGRPLAGTDQYVAIAKGSVVHPQEANGAYLEPPDLVEVPPGNRRYIRINWLTGRASVMGDAVTDAMGRVRIVGQPE